jgi:predicted DNA-binding transcriptional regulator AlpA
MQLMSKKQACFKVGVSRATIDRWRGRSGHPQPVKRGVRVYYVASELDEFILRLAAAR